MQASRLLVASAVLIACSAGNRRDEVRTGVQPVPPDDDASTEDDVVPLVWPDAGADPIPPSTVSTPATLSGGAHVPRQASAHARGRIKAITAAPPVNGEVKWTFVVSDAGGSDTRLVVVLPDGVAFPAADGGGVEAQTSTSGGPNAIGQLLLTDDHGALLIGINMLPAGWRDEYGGHLAVQTGDPFDSFYHRVVVHGPRGKPATLTDRWGDHQLDGARYFGTGRGVKRVLRPGKSAPPGYVSDWIDLILLRVPPAP